MSKPKISDSDICRAANRVGCTSAEIRAFLEVETKNDGFDDLDRPLILFERHQFRKYTKGRYNTSHPGLSGPAGAYGAGGAHQWARYNEAAKLDEWAAMMSTSWGLGQVMGFNHKDVGYPTVQAFVLAMFESEGKQLDASIEYVMHNRLADELRSHDWAHFAAGYNGAGYKKNNYDTKLAAAYQKHARHLLDCGAVDARPAETPVPPTANPAPTQVADTIVNAAPVAPAPPVVPDGPPEQVSNPVAARTWAGGGIALTVLTSIGAWLSSHMNIVVVCVVGGILIVLLIICRSIILDWLRMHIAADPSKRNVK